MSLEVPVVIPIQTQSFPNDLVDFFYLEESNIMDMIKNHESKREVNDCIIVGMIAIYRLINVLHWV